MFSNRWVRHEPNPPAAMCCRLSRGRTRAAGHTCTPAPRDEAPRCRTGARALGISIPLYFQLEMEENRQKTNKKAKQLRES